MLIAILVFYLAIGVMVGLMVLVDTKHWAWDSIEKVYVNLMIMLGMAITWPTYAVYLTIIVIRDATRKDESTDQGKES